MCDVHNNRCLQETCFGDLVPVRLRRSYLLAFFSVLFILSLSGCANEVFRQVFRVRSPQGISGVNLSRFEKTAERTKVTLPGDKPVTVRFEGVTFPIGMRSLTDISGIPIAWDSALDNELLSGTFVNQPLFVVLSAVCQRSKVSLSEFGGGFYLGEFKEGSLASAVVRIPPIDKAELKGALDSFKTENGSCIMVGSFIWIRNTFENVQRIINDLEVLRTKSERSYIAEVFFIRVNEDDFVNLTADLRFNAVDIFASSFNVEQLFSMFVSADGKLGSAVVDTRPVLLLSEGREAKFEVGSEINKERKVINENGTMETSGYDKFSDGIILSLKLNRTSEEKYSVDLNLEVSAFDKTDKTSSVPAKNHSVLTSPGLLVRDGGVVYAGSLKRSEATKVWGIFSLDAGRLEDMLTIWLRVREIQ